MFKNQKIWMDFFILLNPITGNLSLVKLLNCSMSEELHETTLARESARIIATN